MRQTMESVGAQYILGLSNDGRELVHGWIHLLPPRLNVNS
jgi:hypothetical protein